MKIQNTHLRRLSVLLKVIAAVLVLMVSLAVQDLYMRHLAQAAAQEAVNKISANAPATSAPESVCTQDSTGLAQIDTNMETWYAHVESSASSETIPVQATLYYAAPSGDTAITDKYIGSGTALSVQFAGFPDSVFTEDGISLIRVSYPQYIYVGEIGLIHVEVDAADGIHYAGTVSIRAKETLRLIHGYSNPSIASGSDIIRPDRATGTLSLLFYTGATEQHWRRSNTAGIYCIDGDFSAHYYRFSDSARGQLIVEDPCPYEPGPANPATTSRPTATIEDGNGNKPIADPYRTPPVPTLLPQSDNGLSGEFSSGYTDFPEEPLGSSQPSVADQPHPLDPPH